jgi:hypothetical protein
MAILSCVFNPATKEINSIPLANPPNPFKNGFFYFKTEIKSILEVKMPLRVSLNNKANNTVDMVCHKNISKVGTNNSPKTTRPFRKIPNPFGTYWLSPVPLNPTNRPYKSAAAIETLHQH